MAAVFSDRDIWPQLYDYIESQIGQQTEALVLGMGKEREDQARGRVFALREMLQAANDLIKQRDKDG